MYMTIGEKRYDFFRMELEVLEMGIDNTFARFDKMTLKELCLQKKYGHLRERVEEAYCHLLDVKAGAALLRLKEAGDLFYRQFLNNYGDLTFSKFVVRGHDDLLAKKGVYNIIVGDELVFSGVCARAFRERINQHIGNISAKSCYRDGTATHCHLNARLTEQLPHTKVFFSICPLHDAKEMNQLKHAIIKRFEPVWNLRASKEESSMRVY